MLCPVGGSFVEYRTSDDEWVLSLRYADGAIVDAETGPAFSAELEAQSPRASATTLAGTSCAKASTTAVTIAAGPLNYAGVNPKMSCNASS